MPHRLLGPVLLAPLAALLGCGYTPPVKPKPAEPPPPVVSQPPPTLAPRLPDTSPSNPISRPSDLPPPPPVSKELVKPDATPPSTGGGKRVLDEFDPEAIAGRPIGKWMEMLNSDKKDDIIEAAEALKQVPLKAKKAAPRLEELAKNSDKEIADEAKDVLKTIGK